MVPENSKYVTNNLYEGSCKQRFLVKFRNIYKGHLEDDNRVQAKQFTIKKKKKTVYYDVPYKSHCPLKKLLPFFKKQKSCASPHFTQ